ncbi:MAG: hypothetical protein HUU12_02515 [Anaerolineales bacterium]|nr:hypothetical protein [Anaerolineales bacterium]NUQ58241.1 hypothetical protein [Anaerolineales bacterium]
MPPKINNLVDLNQYLDELEKRVISLEKQINYLEKGILIQSEKITDLSLNPPVQTDNKDVIDYLKREKRLKITVRILLAIIGCAALCAIFLWLSNFINTNKQFLGPIP